MYLDDETELAHVPDLLQLQIANAIVLLPKLDKNVATPLYYSVRVYQP